MSDRTTLRCGAAPPSLRASSERAAYQAMFELLDGSLDHRVEGELTVDTEEGRYRFIDGVCFGAPVPDSIGTHLAGWLIESERASAVITRWRCGARAVLAREGSSVRVTGSTVALAHEGAPVDDGFATHDGRLVFSHEADVRPAAESADPVIEVHGEVDGSQVEVSFDDDDDDDRPTLPPCPMGEAVLSSERLIHLLDEPEAPTEPRPPSHAAPPAWALPPIPRLGPLPSWSRDLLDSLDDDRDTAPQIERRDTGA